MSVAFPPLRSVIASGLSLWMALLACLMGCTVPALARTGADHAAALHERSADGRQPDVMADMPNCPHHSTGSVPAQQKPAGGRMSCCPVEVTVTSKPHPVTLHVAPISHSFLTPDFTLAPVRVFLSAKFAPLLEHSGRHTLLQTGLLRI